MQPKPQKLSYIAHPRKIVVETKKFLTLADIERLHICAVMDHTDGNKRASSKILGITQRTLYNKIARYIQEGTLTYTKPWKYFIKLGNFNRADYAKDKKGDK